MATLNSLGFNIEIMYDELYSNGSASKEREREFPYTLGFKRINMIFSEERG